MKTVKDLAADLKVTPQYINRVINQLPISKKPKQVNHSYQISEAAEAAIKDFMSIRHKEKETKQQRNKSLNVSLLQEKISSQLEQENQSLRQQLETKDKQIEKLLNQNEHIQKLVDQEQQLHLSDQKRIDQLEQPENEQSSTNQHNSQVMNSSDNEQEEQPKQGFFKHLFGSK
ncbi:hypothetical protein LL936_10995 [Levilactobacillus brevis]|uniref:Replication protein B n=1 Tax=Ligilactobacillus acidipiscis TaxID=89059 RepID=A0A285PJ64_9LACO|nr:MULTISPECIES: hypothetical protein [Lactobacillaceae]PNW61848.1 hypothetical protein ACZ99_16240 [Lactobacillus sp. ATCC 15578]MBU7449261.1 hypothetical protein [Lactiplantibacillus sp. 7.2.4]MBU7462592.1 hypothetical protein [Lactiplantibacillus pentosus]MBU7465951.1 hypothetical protein [Lactiplantibacillus pentosus]MBU7481690.1 hypothetical protein [Lactiplantibacillus pentosus]